MKILLLKEAPKIGSKNDIVEVKDGHALNFLIPKGYAVMATPSISARVSREKREATEAEEKILERLRESLKKLSEEKIEIKVNANEKGHLFAGIDEEKISSIIREKTGVEVLATAIDLGEHIKETGEHEIKIRAGGKKYSINLIISTEKKPV